MRDHSHHDLFSLQFVTIRSLGSTLSSSASNLMTRLLQRGWVLECPFFLPPVTCLSLVIRISSHSMLHRAQMCLMSKKRRAQRRCFRTSHFAHCGRKRRAGTVKNLQVFRRRCLKTGSQKLIKMGWYRPEYGVTKLPDADTTNGGNVKNKQLSLDLFLGQFVMGRKVG